MDLVLHTSIKSHLCRIGMIQSDVCDCGEERETLDHLLRECNKHEEQRRISPINIVIIKLVYLR